MFCTESYKIVEGDRRLWQAIKVGTDRAGKDILIPDITGNIQTLGAENGTWWRCAGISRISSRKCCKRYRTAVAAYTDLEFNFTPFPRLVDGALRFENYSDFGSTPTGKYLHVIKSGESWAIRGAASTGFRAPHQRYFSATSSLFVDGEIIASGTFTNDSRPCNAGYSCFETETSKNYSLGLPAALGNLNLHVDGYYVKIDNRVIYTGNFTGSNEADASAQDKEIYELLDQVNAQTARFFANAIDTETKGIDAVLTYSDRLGKGRFRADLSGTFVKTNVVGAVKASPW